MFLLLFTSVLIHSTHCAISPVSSNQISSSTAANHMSAESGGDDVRGSIQDVSKSTDDDGRSTYDVTKSGVPVGEGVETSSVEDNDVIRSVSNVTETGDDADRNLKQSYLSGLDIRWGSDRGNHNLVLGKKQDRDELLLRYVCKKDGRWLRTATDEVMWPLYGRKPSNHIIHYVEALDQEVGGRGGFASITKGGVSHKNVTISLKSQRNYGLNFIVSIYGSPEYHETYEDTIVINEKPDKYGVVTAYKPQPSGGYLPPKAPKPVILQAPLKRPSQDYGIDVPAPNGYRPQLGWETDHHANKPNYAPNSQYSPLNKYGAPSSSYGAPPGESYEGYDPQCEESEEDVVESSANQGVYIEQHQYKPTYNPYKPAGSFKPPSSLNAEAYLSSKPKPNVYSHNVEAYKPGEYYVHHQQNYYAKPQKYQ